MAVEKKGPHDREQEFGDPNESGYRTIVATMDPDTVEGATPSDFISAHVTNSGEGEFSVVLEYGLPIKSYSVAGMRGSIGEMKNIIAVLTKTVELIERKQEGWENDMEGKGKRDGDSS